MPGFDYIMREQMKNLAERLQEQNQMTADACHARGEKSPMEELYENSIKNFNEQLEKETENETIKDFEKFLQSKGVAM